MLTQVRRQQLKLDPSGKGDSLLMKHLLSLLLISSLCFALESDLRIQGFAKYFPEKVQSDPVAMESYLTLLSQSADLHPLLIRSHLNYIKALLGETTDFKNTQDSKQQFLRVRYAFQKQRIEWITFQLDAVELECRGDENALGYLRELRKSVLDTDLIRFPVPDAMSTYDSLYAAFYAFQYLSQDFGSEFELDRDYEQMSRPHIQNQLDQILQLKSTIKDNNQYHRLELEPVLLNSWYLFDMTGGSIDSASTFNNRELILFNSRRNLRQAFNRVFNPLYTH